jgi:hypothetical protein
MSSASLGTAVSFWDYLGDRLGVLEAPAIQGWPELIAATAAA